MSDYIQDPYLPIFDLMYFPPIAFWRIWNREGRILIEDSDNYQKGSYRNRTHIAGPNGVLVLSIPLQKGKNRQMPYRDVLIDNSVPWQRSHWRAITSTYGKSPFFEHYQDDLEPLFLTEWTHLFDFNTKSVHMMMSLVNMDYHSFAFSEMYATYDEGEDFRNKIRPNQDFNLNFVEYVQVFANKTGFVPNLSILDLLFCMGPEARRFM